MHRSECLRRSPSASVILQRPTVSRCPKGVVKTLRSAATLFKHSPTCTAPAGGRTDYAPDRLPPVKRSPHTKAKPPPRGNKPKRRRALAQHPGPHDAPTRPDCASTCMRGCVHTCQADGGYGCVRGCSTACAEDRAAQHVPPGAAPTGLPGAAERELHGGLTDGSGPAATLRDTLTADGAPGRLAGRQIRNTPTPVATEAQGKETGTEPAILAERVPIYAPDEVQVPEFGPEKDAQDAAWAEQIHREMRANLRAQGWLGGFQPMHMHCPLFGRKVSAEAMPQFAAAAWRCDGLGFSWECLTESGGQGG